MTRHTMAYVEMAELVRMERGPLGDYLDADLHYIEDELLGAESRLAALYGEWRRIMESAAEAGSNKAREYLRRTTWDLT